MDTEEIDELVEKFKRERDEWVKEGNAKKTSKKISYKAYKKLMQSVQEEQNKFNSLSFYLLTGDENE